MCRTEAEQLNAPYFKLRRTGRPWVILKWAQSLDGKIAARTGDSRWITGPIARREAHRPVSYTHLTLPTIYSV